jgi:hypothetical protein
MLVPLRLGAWLTSGVQGPLGSLAAAAAVGLVAALAYLGVEAALRAPEAGWLAGALGRGGTRAADTAAAPSGMSAG